MTTRVPIKRASAKAAGRKWEKDCATYLQPVWPKVERRRQAGHLDRGDLVNTGDWMIECKCERALTLGEYMNEVDRQKANAFSTYGAVLIRRRNADIKRAYVVMDMEQFRDLLWQLERLQQQ